MKKLLVLLLAALLIMLPVIAVSAASTADVTVSSATAQKGDTVTLTISVSNCTEAKSIYIVPQYDDQVLDIVSGSWLVSGMLADDWSEAFGDAAITFSANTDINTDIFELVFKVKDNAQVGSVADVSCEIVIKTMNGQEEVDVSLSVNDGSVTVICPHTNTQNVPETPAQCNEIGYTAGVYCNDCKTYISGHAEIPATGNHVDADGKWESDGTSHWHTCSCGKKFDKATCSGGTATCQAKALCSTCGNEWGVLGGHDYNTSVWGYKDADGHAHLCKNCTEHDELTSHTPDRDKATDTDDKKCSACDYLLEAALGHDYTEKIRDNAHLKTEAEKCTEYNVYWYDCSRCEANAKDDPAAGDKFYTDTVAGPHIYTEKIADADHLIAGSGTDCQNAKKYYYDCAYCSAVSSSEYWTSTEFGSHKFITSEWGYRVKEEGHAHKCEFCDAHDELQAHVPGTAATEDDDQICTVCKIVLIPATGHLCVNHLTEHAANPNSCTEAGNKAYYECTCGNYYEDALATVIITDKSSVNLPVLGHDYTEKAEDEAHLKTKAVKCTEKSTYWYDCARCDKNAKDDPNANEKYFIGTDAGPHDFSEKIEDAAHAVPGTGVNCLSKYSYYYDCAYCSEKTTESYWTGEKVGEHDIPSDWTTLDGWHWKKCGVEGCTYAADKAECSGGKATCQAKAVCSTCNKEYGDIADHNFSTEWSVKDGSHWHACVTSGCTEIKDKAVCSGGKATCQAKAVCAICTNEYGTVAEHVYGTEWEYNDSDGHSLVCQTAGCGELKKLEQHNPDSLNEKCLDCGYVFHNCGGKELTLIPENPGTCESSGMKAYYMCSCGKYYRDVYAEIEITDLDSLKIPAGHKRVKEYGYPATCTVAGLTDGEYCSVCNTVFEAQTIIPASGHDWSAWVTVEMFDDGTKVLKRSCSCGVSEENTILPEHNHTVAETESQAPTCTESGLTAGTQCSVCGEVITPQEIIPALGHTVSEAVKENIVEASEIAEGSYDLVVYCSVCFAEISRETVKVEMLEHKHVAEELAAVEATCTKNGLTAGTQCSVCGEIITPQESIPALGHTLSEAVKENIVEATETAEGSYDLVVYCSVCFAEISRETVTLPALEAEITESEVTESEVTESEVTEPVNPGTYDNAFYIIMILIAAAVLGGGVAVMKKRND